MYTRIGYFLLYKDKQYFFCQVCYHHNFIHLFFNKLHTGFMGPGILPCGILGPIGPIPG